ncbi:MAG TPA: DNA mismatch repair endonuclease MutL [Fimbriimonadaceae bacterium]|nr:DNA mismatch repair endonuclease MutL [Fimbriimonadaceae bacterium]
MIASALPRRVRLLDPHTVNQIAAGEVVERPASVVKELLENALDAGATRIEIELVDQGRRKIRIVDNGCGMVAVDAETALQRHATSKIGSVGDLQRVETLGFRGEALPSIASVARMRLSTGTEDGLRVLLEIEGGRIRSGGHEAGPKGTEIVVEDLFFNTPARLKFLKSDATELSACVDTVSRYVLAYPQVAIALRHQGQTLFSSSGDGDLLAAIAAIWGREVAKALAEIDSVAGGVRVRGFVSPPHLTKPTRAFQWIFVNGRPIRSRALGAAIDQAYRSLTPERRYPIAVLLLDIDPVRVDMNVSPTKSEVRFQSEGQAFDAVRHAIKSGLMAHGMVPSAEELVSSQVALATVGRATSEMFAREPRALFDVSRESAGTFGAPGGGTVGPSGRSDQAYADRAGRGCVYASALEAQAPLLATIAGADIDGPAGIERGAEAGFSGGDLLDGLRIIGQLMSTFILAENRRGLLIVDQHVAHERVLFEMLRDQRGRAQVERQSLLTPETIALDRRAAAVLAERLDEVREVGYELEAFGGESFLVRAIPAALRSKNALGVLRDLAEELADGLGSGCVTPARESIWIMASCKMAIKAGDPMTPVEMEKLLVDLAATENPYLCPHGRPITLVLGRTELLRKFKR